MSGIFWPAATYAVILIFVVLMIYRIVSIKHRPVHLRWELAPVPYDKSRAKYGGSYLEEYEWWNKPRRKSFFAVPAYMLQEILFMKAVWKGNRSLWPFSISLHLGIYFYILSLILYFVSALLIITGVPSPIIGVFTSVTAVVLAAGCIVGIPGTAGLLLKRLFDHTLKNYSSFTVYFRLVLLLALFVSGGIALLLVDDYVFEMNSFVKNVLTPGTGTPVPAGAMAHIIVSYLFILYLPFTNMVHFITKYFTYHAVRWNDEPKNGKMEVELKKAAAQPVGWSAKHTKTASGKLWSDLAGKPGEKENR